MPQLHMSGKKFPVISAKLRSGWGTPVFHLAHLNFFERLERLGFTCRIFPGAPSSDFMHRVFSASLPLADGNPAT